MYDIADGSTGRRSHYADFFRVGRQGAFAVGVEEPGRVARDMFGLDRPNLDWVSLSKGMGVDAEKVEDAVAFTEAFQRGLATPGPYVIEAVF